MTVVESLQRHIAILESRLPACRTFKERRLVEQDLLHAKERLARLQPKATV